MLTLSRTLPLGSSFLLIRYTYTLYITELVSLRTMLLINDSGLFVWINLAALFRTYFIKLESV